jgi:2-C-methyl-D-erythritol 2,4-cyclodiphosphate synthase
MTIRIGQGWDRHPLVEGRPCILGGVLFKDSPMGPLGHSDGDALTHALIDALLGASALGDIGQLFSDTDPQYAGADSLDLLSQTWNLIQKKGFTLENADCTIITEAPKISPFAQAIKDNLSQTLGVDAQQISIKATRGEGLGPEGRGECVTAMATVLLTRGKPE